MLLIFNVLLDAVLVVFWFWAAGKRREHEGGERLLAQQELFFARLSEQYGRCQDLPEALEESAQGCGSALQREVAQILALLEGGFLEGAGGYAKRAKNAYFVLLLTLCETIRTFGDMPFQGVSLFTYNIRYIREEVRVELLRRREGRYAFLGLTMLCIVPFFFTLPIRWWSHSISMDMDRYYSGSYGFVTLMTCFFLTVVCVCAVQELQYPAAINVREDSLERRLLALPFIRAVLDRHIARHYSRCLKKNEMLKVLQGFGNIREFLVKKVLAAAGLVLLFGLLACGSAFFGGSGAHTALPVALLFCALVGYALPDAWVVIQQARVEQQKTEETMRFETLILIVMNYRQITVEEILRWMECFSLVFSKAFERAVDDFSYHRQEALKRLSDELAYGPAKKLVAGLIACDEIPVAQAFYDMEGERAYDMEQYKKKEEAAQREKAALARVIAFLPFVAILALWMIVPFVMEGLTQLGSY